MGASHRKLVGKGTRAKGHQWMQHQLHPTAVPPPHLKEHDSARFASTLRQQAIVQKT